MITAEQECQLAELWATSVGHYMRKFASMPQQWYVEAMPIANTAGLHEGPPLNILDIGTGFGYFQLACRALGHTTVGLDVPDDVIRKATDILGVSYVEHTIRAYEALPDVVDAPGLIIPEVLTGYDLITTFGVNFRRDDETYWGPDEYAFLAGDIRTRLRPGGCWLLRPNQTDDSESPIADLMDVKWWRDVVGVVPGIKVTEHEVQIRW